MTMSWPKRVVAIILVAGNTLCVLPAQWTWGHFFPSVMVLPPLRLAIQDDRAGRITVQCMNNELAGGSGMVIHHDIPLFESRINLRRARHVAQVGLLEVRIRLVGSDSWQTAVVPAAPLWQPTALAELAFQLQPLLARPPGRYEVSVRLFAPLEWRYPDADGYVNAPLLHTVFFTDTVSNSVEMTVQPANGGNPP